MGEITMGPSDGTKSLKIGASWERFPTSKRQALLSKTPLESGQEWGEDIDPLIF